MIERFPLLHPSGVRDGDGASLTRSRAGACVTTCIWTPACTSRGVGAKGADLGRQPRSDQICDFLPNPPKIRYNGFDTKVIFSRSIMGSKSRRRCSGKRHCEHQAPTTTSLLREASRAVGHVSICSNRDKRHFWYCKSLHRMERRTFCHICSVCYCGRQAVIQVKVEPGTQILL